MTTSKHVYTAAVIGTPDIALTVKGGSLSLDASSTPHVTGTLSIAIPSLATQAALDPRTGARIRVNVSATFPAVTNTRTFNLNLRARPIRHADGTMTLTLASDEALLADYAPLADDDTPFTLAASLRAVVNYVLNKAIPGAALQATPATDADMTPYWSVTNMLNNPGVDSALTPWTAWGNCTLFHSTLPRTGANSCGATSSAAGDMLVSPMPIAGKNAVTAGRVYSFGGYGRKYLSSARTLTAGLRWVNSDGASPWADVLGTAVALSETVWTRATVTGAVAPAGAVSVVMFFRISGQTASGQIAYLVDAVFNEGKRLADYFAGNTTGGGYTYAWAGTAYASFSTRTPVVERSPDSLTWKAGQSARDFLHTLYQAAGKRLVCDEARTWTLRPDGYSASGALNIRYGVNFIDGTDNISRDSGIWFDGAVAVYTWNDAAGITQTAVDSYATTATPTRVMRFDFSTPYPGPGFAQYIVKRAQGRGREVSATIVPSWTEAAEQPITITLPAAPIQVGQTIAIQYNLDADECTVTTRTTDTPVGAIDLLAGTINGLAGTINSL